MFVIGIAIFIGLLVAWISLYSDLGKIRKNIHKDSLQHKIEHEKEMNQIKEHADYTCNNIEKLNDTNIKILGIETTNSPYIPVFFADEYDNYNDGVYHYVWYDKQYNSLALYSTYIVYDGYIPEIDYHETWRIEYWPLNKCNGLTKNKDGAYITFAPCNVIGKSANRTFNILSDELITIRFLLEDYDKIEEILLTANINR